MAVRSMTGFARVDRSVAGGDVAVELRSVNGKGFDLRLRLPGGLEHLEAELRRRASARLTRGNVQANLQIRRAEAGLRLTVNEDLLARLVAVSGRLVADGHATPPTADGLLSMRGVVDFAERDAEAGEAEAGETEAGEGEILEAFDEAIERLVAVRTEEGKALSVLLEARLSQIEALVAKAEADPARSRAAIAARLADQVRMLIDREERLDPGRLEQEAALLATRADIREELDRLTVSLASARALLSTGGAIGRRLDFLSQEFHRESNTICSKSNAASLTAIGLEMKVAIDQFREQVQNIE